MNVFISPRTIAFGSFTFILLTSNTSILIMRSRELSKRFNKNVIQVSSIIIELKNCDLPLFMSTPSKYISIKCLCTDLGKNLHS